MKFFGGSFMHRHPLVRVSAVPEIITARLHLRALVETDCPAIVRYLDDYEVARWLVRVPHPFTLSDAAAFVDQSRVTARAGTAATLGLVDLGGASDTVIGILALHSLDGKPEFGYWLGRPFWGRGLMGEAVEAMLDWAFQALPLDEVSAGAFAGNVASLAIQRRQGFVEIGRSRRLSLAEGHDCEHIDTLLTRQAHAERNSHGGRPG